jgi:hypothetical protein
MTTQVPDTRPGNYYVTVRDGGRTGLLAGPFVNDHAAALAMVDAAMKVACELHAPGYFFSYGTARMPSDVFRPGTVNAWLVLPPTADDVERLT